MMNLNARTIVRGSSLLGIGCLCVTLFGCGGVEEEISAPRVARNAAPSAPAPSISRVVPIATLMDQLGIDERIVFPEDKAPEDTASRKALLEFFDAFARSDNHAVSDMLSVTDRYDLDQLVESGKWSETTDQITEILLEASKSPEGIPCVMAIFEIGDTYQPQLWYYDAERGDFLFEAASSPPNIIDRLYGLDPIAVWHEIIQEEMDIALLPDEEVIQTKVVVDDGPSRGGASASPGGDGPRGINPGIGAPIQAPGSGVPGPTPGGG